jgi:hypothetical protein
MKGPAISDKNCLGATGAGVMRGSGTASANTPGNNSDETKASIVSFIVVSKACSEEG